MKNTSKKPIAGQTSLDEAVHYLHGYLYAMMAALAVVAAANMIG